MLGVGKLLKAVRPPSQLPQKGATTQRRASRPPSRLPRGRAASRRCTGRLPSRPSRGGAAAPALAPPPPSSPLGTRADPLVLRRPLPLPLLLGAQALLSARPLAPPPPSSARADPLDLAVTRRRSSTRARPSVSIVGVRGPAWSGRHKEEQQLPRPLLLLHRRLLARADPLVLHRRR